MNGPEEQIAETTGIEQTTDTLATGFSRRAAVRGLVAGLIAVAGGGISSATDTRAKKKGKKNRTKAKKEASPQTVSPTTPTTTPHTAPGQCPRGTSIAYLAVPANGSQVFTPVLKAGQPYILRASGYWSTNGDYMNDAFAAFLWKNQQSPVLYHNGVRLGLAVNGESPDLWGSYRQSHVYNLVVIGKGQPVSLQMLDSVYSDNSRLLNVEVLCAAPLRD